ncbi:U-box domain-containing protein 33-like isoform X2 [Aristolochia californica]
MNDMLRNYLSICGRLKVQISIAAIEAGQIHRGIVDLVTRYGIRKLVMGAAPDSCMKVKRSSDQARNTAKNAPNFCEIWFVYKGKHVWTRDASDGSQVLQSLPSINNLGETPRSKSLPTHGALSFSTAGCHRTQSSSTDRYVKIDSPESQSSRGYTSTFSELSSPLEGRASSEFNLKEEQQLDNLKNTLLEVRIETERSKQEAFSELLKCKELEKKAAETMNKVRAYDAAYAHEAEIRREVEEELQTTKEEHERLLRQRDEAKQELDRTMRTLALLETQAQEAAHHRNEATRELKLIQTSMTALRRERKKIRRQRQEAMLCLDKWRNYGLSKALKCERFLGFSNESLAEFSLSDLQTATCDFSESFKIGQGGYGCVYKGEILEVSVAIKKFHPDNMQGRSEFQQEVQVLRELKHPNLVTLIGACFEAWSLVYEYLPNGNLQDYLFCKASSPPLTWKARIHIMSEIGCALVFLHSGKPEKIVHGNLKPENILLDSEFNCKICDFGISQLVPEETPTRKAVRQNTGPKGSFHYTDPEFQRTGELTPKSDVYSFGIIILQLLTGRPPVGLASEVRRAVSSGSLASLLDPMAGEWPTFQARRLAELGLQFTEINSRDRPDLTVATVRELEQLHVVEERPVPHFFLCPILQEIMHDPQVAADGFTYEGDAIRRWLENGCETSPMTNLKLKHLKLTPNYSLRFAIQDWLRQS